MVNIKYYQRFIIQAVESFLQYLIEWRDIAITKNYEFITESTYYGLLITLKATLELCDYLVKQCGFTYLLTARLCQDAIEVCISFTDLIQFR